MTIFPDYERQLVEAAARAAAFDPYQPRGLPRRRSLAGFATGLAAIAAIGVVVLAVALLGHGRTGITPASRGASPSALTALRSQSGELLGPLPGLKARVRALRGLPVVINVWASWCSPCRADFQQFAPASIRYGSQVAFVGADIDDTRPAARSFLSREPIGYPSYQASKDQLGSILNGNAQGIEGLPTTIFVDRAGKVVHEHAGQYTSVPALEHDIAVYLHPRALVAP